MYKLYVRPHFGYGDIIYHKFDPEFALEFTRKLESTQYTAVLAVSRAWRGTNRNKLYDGLGWKYLYHRKLHGRLTHFFKLSKSESPQYLYNLVPPLHEVKYDLRRPRAFEQCAERTNRFSNTYFQSCPCEWNQLDLSIQSCQNISEFKRKLIQLVRPPTNSIFNIHDIIGTKLLTRFRVEFSDLRCHKFRHDFNCSNPSCLVQKTMNIFSCTACVLLLNAETFLTWFLACLMLKLCNFPQTNCLIYYSMAIQILRQLLIVLLSSQ